MLKLISWRIAQVSSPEALTPADRFRTESHLMPKSHDENDDRAALDLLVRGFQVSRMLRLVADLGIADRSRPMAMWPSKL